MNAQEQKKVLLVAMMAIAIVKFVGQATEKRANPVVMMAAPNV
jgi:hypothetical protein